MNRHNHYFLFFLLSCFVLHRSTAFAPKPRRLTAPLEKALCQTGGGQAAELKDYSGEASGLFGNVRIPAALFAGASAGAAFAMPLGHGAEAFRVAMVKRVYALLMMGSLSSQILAVVIATLAVGSLATSESKNPTSSVAQLIRDKYHLEWIGTRWHFLSGVLMFVVGLGLRAWVTISCPVFAKAALGVIVSSALLCVAFIEHSQQGGELLDGFVKLPFKYIQLFLERAKGNPLFALAFVAGAVTNIYILAKVPHIVHYLSSVAV